MASELKVKAGTSIVLKNTGGDYALTLTSLASGTARQSAKIDLGDSDGYWSSRYLLEFRTKIASAPTAGNRIEIWAAYSLSATAATANDAQASGSDALYTSHAARSNQLQFVDSLVVTADGSSVEQKMSAELRPLSRYVMIIVVNECGQNLSSTAADHIVTLSPLPGTQKEAS